MIPVCEPRIGETERRYVLECLETGWISSAGRFIPEFEEAFARYCGRRHGVAVNNGTSALIAGLRALDLPPGSEVILPSFTIISCALACLYNDLVPVFVDADPETWCMDVGAFDAHLSDATRAIMAVHIYGHPVDMDRLLAFAEMHRLKVVEDFAEAIGAEYRGRRCGGFGDVSCASFYANKTITTGEGGMCLTDDRETGDRLASLRNLCFGSAQRFVHEGLGFNFRMTNIQAALGLAQLEQVDQHVASKRAVARSYGELLDDLQRQGLVQLPIERLWARSVYWMYGLILSDRVAASVGEVARGMAERGVQTRPFFHPLHEQPVFASLPWHRPQSLPVAERIARRGLYLPSGITLTPQEMEQVARSLAEVLDAV